MLPKNQPQPSSGVKFEIAGVMIIATALLLISGLLDFSVGRVGYLVAKVARYGFGVGAAGIAVVLLIIGLRYVTAHSHIIYSRRFIGYLLTYAAVLAMIHQFSTPADQEILPEYLPTGGGLAGGIIVMTLRRFFAIDGTTIFLAAAIICSLLLATGFSLSEFFFKLKVWFSRLWDKIKKPAIADKTQAKSITGPQLLTIDPLHPALKPSFYNQEKDEPVRVATSLPRRKKEHVFHR